MRRLRSGAVDAATVRLPAAVRQIEREGPEAVVAVPPVLPIEAKVGPETREVAQALDGLTGEAIRLATSQVRLRQSLDEAFVAMSRRSQSMVEKQLAIIDELESTEEDPEQLRNLFRLDHLAARMRRYNDNLLVLAGSAVRTRSSAPVAIADVFRAATSEMEQYERVRLQPLSGASVAGASAGGLIHLVAELLDNAAMYSPPTSPIVLAAAYTHEGGLRLEVTDSGVGIPPAELADLNARLAMPGTIDNQVPSRMGLYVVARLAQRGGFGVRLAARAQAAGTVAEITVPKALVLGAPTGPLEMVPAAPPATPPATPAETPRLPAQHSSTATPMGGVTRPGGRAKGPRTRPPSGPSVSPATPTHSAPPAVAGTSSGAAALPSRRPGAALAGNPLASRLTDQPPTGLQPPTGDAEPAPAAAAPSPFLSPAPWSERPAPPSRNGAPGGEPDLPRRDPGSTGRARIPFTAPGAATGGPGPFEPPVTRRSEGHELPTAVPGHRPGARPLPVRAPGQPGGGPAIGPSAATAIAAAASARSRPLSAPPKGGLFSAATTTPAETAARATKGAVDETAARATKGAVDDTPPAPAAPSGTAVAPPAPPTTAASAAAVLPSSAPVAVPPALPAPSTTPTTSAPPATAAASATASAPATTSAPEEGQGEATRGSPSPFEIEARAAAAASTGPYHPADPRAPMIGAPGGQPERAQTPIFDSISVWFSDDRTASVARRPAEPAQVIDLREGAGRPPAAAPPTPSAVSPDVAQIAAQPAGTAAGTATVGSRWASLGDQRWIATNMRAAAAPETAGATSAGLPRRRPGANLLPSAAAAAGTPTAAPTPPARRTDAESVRGRLGSYQRGLSSARRARHLPAEPDSGGVFNGGTEAGKGAGRQGGDS
jgi:signal transduction histidine kinase